MPNGPIGQQSAATPAGHAQLRPVDVAAPNDFVYTGHQVFIVVDGIVVLDNVAKVLAIRGAATRVWIEHDIALRRHPLKLVVENVSIRSVRAAMNVEDQWILPVQIKIGWLLDPRLNALAVETLVPDFFRLSQVQVRKQFVVEVGQLSWFGAGVIQPEKIADPGRHRNRVDK